MALTKRDLDRFTYDPEGPSQQIHFDGAEIPGFGVRVYPSGVKSFVLTYRPAGSKRSRILALGRYGVLTLHQAREEARSALIGARGGSDPLETKQKALRGKTVRDLAAMYLVRHAKAHKKSWKEDERRLNRYVIPALGSRKVEEVKRADVARLHASLGQDKPYEANRVLALLAVMFNKAAEWGLVEEGVPNPATRVQKYRERSRDRWVTPDEMPRLMEAIHTEGNPFVQAALKLYLLTGLRKSELLGLRWTDVALTRREIRLGDTKAGRSHVVPLSAPAVDILKGLPRLLGNDYVLAGSVPGRPLVNISKAWLRVRKAAELEDVRLHDLRRTVGSWLAASGASLHLIGKVLNHSNASTTQVYARLAEDAPREALEIHGATLMGMAERA